jgi:hypothetical protein
MVWKYERRLVFVASEDWSGWFCERCCWNRRLPASSEEKQRLARSVQSEYLLHDCTQFAHDHWKAAAGD